MEEQCICVQNLTKTFSDRVVVDDLSFGVKRGEVLALLGHNGAGKSTTIDLILGLKAPDHGSATIPAEVFPSWFRAVTKVMPLGIGIDLLKSVSLGCYDRVILPVLTLAAITAVCGFVAVKTFRWE